MAHKKVDPESIAQLTREMFHAHYAGHPEKWFAYLCPESVYIGTGEPMLIGATAIRERFSGYAGHETDILGEEYHPISLGHGIVQVVGEILAQSRLHEVRVVNRFTIGWKCTNARTYMMMQHNSYEYEQLPANEGGKGSPLAIDTHTMKFIRSLILEAPSIARVPITCGGQTLVLNPYVITHVRSQRKRSQVFCIGRTIDCNESLAELAKRLPQCFYQPHRSFLVNTKYLVGISRFELELADGTRLPIPEARYQDVKRDLIRLVQ